MEEIQAGQNQEKNVAFPPPNPANHVPMYDAVVQAVAELGRGWTGHVAENLRHAAQYRAQRGDIARALAMAEHIPEVMDRLCAGANLTAIASSIHR